MDFQESVEYLHSLGNEVLTMKLGLTATETLLEALDNPEKNFLKIQIAGTNGKGSTCAFLDAICQSAKIKTGLFTSPHLISITERIKISGAEIGENDFARHATRVRKISEELVLQKKIETVPTFFEQITAIAVSAFAEAKIELAILETGLGGRFDAATATRAEIIGITRIDFDHQNFLGNTLSQIAAEKAAIIRKDTEVVLAEQTEEAGNILTDACVKFGVEPNLTRFRTDIVGTNEEGKFTVNFQTKKANYENIQLSLLGKHQVENAKTAILLAEILQESNFKISSENIIKGLENAIHHGRLEFFKDILFDGAHNIGGAKALKNYFDEFVSRPVTMIFGAMRDKDMSEIAGILFPAIENLIFTKPDNPRSLEIAELMPFLPADFDRKKVFQIENVSEALKAAKEISSGDDLICVTGSLYLVGEARKILKSDI